MSNGKIIFKEGAMFKRIENESDYFVSRCGKVYSSKSDKILATRVSINGYERVSFNKKKHYIHRLVAMTFIGEIGYGKGCKMHIDHIDSNKLNNHASNLRAINRRDNIYREKNGFTGATLLNGKWISQIRVNGTLNYLGQFETQEQAHSRYKIARLLIERDKPQKI